MKIITLLNEKGGVGKTTVATHIAAGFAIRGAKVLLLDTDAQGHATIAFGLEKSPGFYDYTVRQAPIKSVVQIIPPAMYALPDDASSISGSLAVIPSNQESRSIAGSISDVFIVLKRLHQIRDVFDYVIIDTPPTPSLLHSAIYAATDGIIYPTKCESWSFDGLNESLIHKGQFDPFREKFGLPNIELLGIVPTLYRASTVEHSENLKDLREAFGDKVWQPMSQLTIWAEAAGLKRSIFSVAPQSRAAKEAWAMVDRLEGILHVSP